MKSIHINVEEELNKYNRNIENKRLKEHFSSTTFFDIIGKSRNETAHSSFLAWVLSGKDLPGRDNENTVIGLLDAIIRRIGCQHKEWQNPNSPDFNCAIQDLKYALMTRDVHLNNIKVVTEKVVTELVVDNKKEDVCKSIQNAGRGRKGKKDSVDIFVTADISGIKGKDKIQIFIENKIGSKEGGFKGDGTEYGKKTQTERYYWATETNDLQILQLYVFLSPESEATLSAYSGICKDPHYTRLNYQDIYDDIITPLLESGKLAIKEESLLRDYERVLSIPAAIGYSDSDEQEDEASIGSSIILATSAEEKEKLVAYWKRNQKLLLAAIHSYEECNEDDVKQHDWTRYLYDNEDVLFCKKDVIEHIFKEYKESGGTVEQFNSFTYSTAKQNRKYEIIETNGTIKECTPGKISMVFEAIKNELQLQCYIKKWAELCFDLPSDKEKEVLVIFWRYNANIVMAACRVLEDTSVLSDDDRTALMATMKGISVRDYSKYTIETSAEKREGLSKLGVVEWYCGQLLWSGKKGAPPYKDVNKKIKKLLGITKGKDIIVDKNETGYKAIEHNGQPSSYYFLTTGWTAQGNFAKLKEQIESMNDVSITIEG